MRIFNITEAKYFISNFTASHGDSEKSIHEFQNQHLRNNQFLREGTFDFNRFRDCLLREIERSLFYAISQYRRSLDLMISSSSAWAHVTLYYGS